MSAVPVQKPVIVARPKPSLRVEAGTQPSAMVVAIARLTLFTALTLVVFFSSSLTGQVMVERARRDGMRATERARAAVREESLLRDRILSITQSSSIDAWAIENGFVAPEYLASSVPTEKSNGPSIH